MIFLESDCVVYATSTPGGIGVVHKPTGLETSCSDFTSTYKNRLYAIEHIKSLVEAYQYSILLVEQLWLDPWENHNSYGYSPKGVLINPTEECINLLLAQKVPADTCEYPLKYICNGEDVPKYKLTPLKHFSL
jgi:hypothetical protein